MSRLCINSYPDFHRFAFTLVHDADSAYSRRLQPVVDAFTERDMPITLTVFTLWADWARGGRSWHEWMSGNAWDRYIKPVAVPLQLDSEAEFYRAQMAEGHEIAMHAASETSDNREQLLQAIDLFAQRIGELPQTYVEHSQLNNLDAQQQLGSSPDSEYFNNDILTDSGFWIWVDHRYSLCKTYPHHNVIAGDQSVFDRQAQEVYGLKRAFRRSGGPKHASGPGFLECYSRENIDDLENNRGLAIHYAHLDDQWLDIHRGTLLPEISDRLDYIKSKQPWCATAATILNRMSIVSQIKLLDFGDTIVVENQSNQDIQGLSLLAQADIAICRATEPVQNLKPNDIYVIGQIDAGQKARLRITSG